MQGLAPRIWKHQKAGLFAREMGYALLAGGAAHVAAVTLTYLMNGFPSHDRVGYIYFIGAIQLATGYLDLLVHQTLKSSSDLAKKVALLAAFLISACAIIISPTYLDFSPLFKLAPPIYLTYHWWLVFKIRKRIKADNTPLQ